MNMLSDTEGDEVPFLGCCTVPIIVAGGSFMNTFDWTAVVHSFSRARVADHVFPLLAPRASRCLHNQSVPVHPACIDATSSNALVGRVPTLANDRRLSSRSGGVEFLTIHGF